MDSSASGNARASSNTDDIAHSGQAAGLRPLAPPDKLFCMIPSGRWFFFYFGLSLIIILEMNPVKHFF
jgi:hypothetical protein